MSYIHNSELENLSALAAPGREEELLQQVERLVAEKTAELSEENTANKQAAEQAQQTLAANEILVKEIHHRVKNNLQIISSLIDLQMRKVEDPKAVEAFEDNRNRIFALALIHENLHDNKELAHIEFSTYTKALLQMLNDAYDGEEHGIALKLELQPINIGIDSAVPCGLIVNEIASNAFKHAFAKGQSGTIGVKLSRDELGEIHLDIWDDGIGLPAENSLERPDTLGLRLIKTLTGQLGGKIELNNQRGTRFELRFQDRSKH